MTQPLTPLPPHLEPLLARVQAPGQYVGGEVGSICKPEEAVRLRIALAFPDLYGIGMSHHGLRILYELINAMEGFAAERVFAPQPDMESELRNANVPLMTLETFTPLSECDAIGVSLSYEMCATTLLTMLDLAQVPLLRTERTQGDPLILAGGHVTFNPEPFVDFIDAFFIGESEESLAEALRIIEAAGGRNCADRNGLLEQLASEVDGIYVPSLYQTAENADGFQCITGTAQNAPLPVNRRTIDNLDALPSPTHPVVPVHETVHERVTLEIMRGCPNGCRFCQAGFVCRPQRERSPETLLQEAKACYRNTGFDEIGLLSLSTSNHSRFDEIVSLLDKEFAPKGVSLSLPSLRVDHALSDIPRRFKTVRRSGFTIAPEAGSDRLRASINKDVTNENLLNAAEEAYSQGWSTIKLYFMVGLPGETDEDVVAIAHLANEVARRRRKKARKPAVNLAVSNFVPKPHTPFQWEAMASADAFAAKQALVKEHVNTRAVNYSGHDPFLSVLEGVLSRGDRRLGKTILRAWELGARLDAWHEWFRPELWQQALEETEISIPRYTQQERDDTLPLPWSHINLGIAKAFLKSERERAREALHTPMCSPEHCAGCGLKRCPLRDGNC